MSIFSFCLASDPREEHSKESFFKSIPNETVAYNTLEPLLADESWETPVLPEKLSAALIKIFSQDNPQEDYKALSFALCKAERSFEIQAGILDKITFRKPQ